MKAQVKMSGGRKPEEREVRPMAKEDYVNGTRPVLVESNNGRNSGTFVEVRWNGAARTWKTRPDEVERSAKYGLYEHIVLGTRAGNLPAYTLSD